MATCLRSRVCDLELGAWFSSTRSTRSTRSTGRMFGAGPGDAPQLPQAATARALRVAGLPPDRSPGARDVGRVEPKKQRRLVVVDFDDTCTLGDTISHLVSATKALQPAHVAEEKDRTYAMLFREYMEERKELIDRLFDVTVEVPRTSMPGVPEDDDGDDGDDGDIRCPKRAWLAMFLHELSCFETRRNDVVLASGILHGATIESIAGAAQNVVFRDACIETLHRASVSVGTSVVVLSANWSEEFIRAALSNHHGACGGFDAARVEVVANALEFDAGVTTGGMRVRRCQTPNDKHRLLRGLVFDGHGQHAQHPSVYVGDSVGDVPALLSANVGIVMGRNALLERVLERGGVQIRSIDEIPGGTDGVEEWGMGTTGAGRPSVVWQTSSWEDVRCALGLK